MPANTVIVYGPRACGKTRHAEALMKHFNCNSIVDESTPWFTFKEGALHLTAHDFTGVESFTPMHWANPIRVVPFADAMAEMGAPKKPLSVLVEEAKARVAAMSPEEREAMWQVQRESWVRGEMAMGETSVVAMPAKQAHPLSDEQIAEFWPDADPADIRRQFDALMAQIAHSSWKPFPKYHEHMAGIVVEKARTLPDRVNGLKAALAGLPEHWRNYQWACDAKQSFGEKYVRVIGDDGHGMGRQYIAAIPAGPKGYFGTLGEFIAAANPDTVGMLLAFYEANAPLQQRDSADSDQAEMNYGDGRERF